MSSNCRPTAAANAQSIVALTHPSWRLKPFLARHSFTFLTMLVPLLVLVFIPSLLLTIAFLFLLLYIALYRAPCTTRRTSLGRSAAVVVLGDVGRSPRMCYHVESLADQGWKVSVVGYGGSKLPNSIQRSSIRLHKLSQVPEWIAKLPRIAFIAVAPLKLLWQSVGLFWKITMVIQPPPEIILVQTPPALPTLFVVRLCSLLLSCRVVIDWHNLAYTILALRLGPKSPLVALAAWLERITGRNAFAHLFVTHAMKNHLDRQWHLKGHKAVLHDRPPRHFRKAKVAETHRLWKGLSSKMSPPLSNWWPDTQDASATPFTRLSATGEAHLRTDRPALAVSSTSWTADEDFGMLLRAAQLYEKRARSVNGASPTRRDTTTHLSSSSRDTTHSIPVSDSPRGSLDEQSFPTHNHTSSSGSLIFPSSTSGSSLGPPQDRSPSPGGHSQPVDLSPSASLSSFRTGTATPHRLRRPSVLFQRSSTLPNYPAATLPKLLIVVTGKGDLRAQYEREIARLESEEDWQWVRIRTAWLENWEYPLLLGSADVGISLHTSSSGIDLPMKVVDMLGCHLPVLALDFPCLGELVQQGRNGLKFSNDEGLAEGLESLLGGFPYGDGSSGSPDCNWLVQSGGLREPFAHAGQDLGTTDEEGGDGAIPRSSEERRSLSSATRPSLDVLGGNDEAEDQRTHRLKRKSFEFSKAGLPTSQVFGGTGSPGSGSTETGSGSTSGRVSPNLIGLSSSASAPAFGSTGGGGGGGALPPLRPTTPTPNFTMLASPVLGGSGFFQSAMANATSTTPGANSWAENWKANVRPLIRLADAEDAKAEGVALSDEEEVDLDLDLMTTMGEENDDDELTALLPSLSSTRDTFAASTSASSGDWPATGDTSTTVTMQGFRFGGAANGDAGEEEIPQRRGSKRIARPSRRRMGSNGRPLRIRGGSVQGLLWAEDFRMSRSSDANGSRSAGDDEDEDGIELGLFGSVVTKKRSPERKRTRGHRAASSKGGSLATLMGTKKRDDDDDGGGVGGDGGSTGDDVTVAVPSALTESGGHHTPRHLRKRTGAGGTPAAPSRRESVPDIWVSGVEEG